MKRCDFDDIQIIESSHPYSRKPIKETVTCEGASSVLISFSKECSIDESDRFRLSRTTNMDEEELASFGQEVNFFSIVTSFIKLLLYI